MSRDFWKLTLTPSPDALHQSLGGETVLLNLRTEQYFGLDETGTRIWELILASHSPEAIVDQLLAEFDVERSQAAADVERLVAELEQAGLVERAER